MEESIVKNLTLIDGWEEKIDEFTPCISAKVIKTEQTKLTIDRHRKYFLDIHLGVEFWANQAQLSDSIRQAREVFSNRLYGDLKSLVMEVVHQIRNGDKSKALYVCEQMMKYMEPPK